VCRLVTAGTVRARGSPRGFAQAHARAHARMQRPCRTARRVRVRVQEYEARQISAFGRMFAQVGNFRFRKRKLRQPWVGYNCLRSACAAGVRVPRSRAGVLVAVVDHGARRVGARVRLSACSVARLGVHARFARTHAAAQAHSHARARARTLPHEHACAPVRTRTALR